MGERFEEWVKQPGVKERICGKLSPKSGEGVDAGFQPSRRRTAAKGWSFRDDVRNCREGGEAIVILSPPFSAAHQLRSHRIKPNWTKSNQITMRIAAVEFSGIDSIERKPND